LRTLIGPEPHTPIEVALTATLHGGPSAIGHESRMAA
jgi:hypothetical protein